MRAEEAAGHWFRGGDAASAWLSSVHAFAEAWTFRVGGRFDLVTADHGGVVPVCGGADDDTRKAERLFRIASER
ncbi:hypothetical protein ACWDUC_04050 [Streptomyces tricolor]|uniref:hypothetical protein n=1 Tax=unclassified Streptomyces TaxID=2593676 RepID=UPI000B97234F|nr:hypothetical protein [Streptomyces sp. FBKL.4005]OYP19217.1 hypothetical protein CFC35_35970 [Streptomyces sp. FBKL.4005]